MKYMLISDIHGSASALKRALAFYETFGCDRLMILGDILYHGPRNPLPEGHDPQGVVALLNPMKDQILAVRGNCEAEVDQMMLEFPCMGDYLLIEDSDISFFATHGHIYNPGKMPSIRNGSVFLYGHTHIWQLEKNADITFCNTGSISLPKQNNPPTFVIYDNGEISVFDLTSGNILKTLWI